MREWSKILFKILKEKPHQSRNLYSANLFFKNEGQIKTYRWTNIQEIVASTPALQTMWKKFYREKETMGQKLRYT